LVVQYLTRAAAQDFVPADSRSGRFEARVPADRCRLTAVADGYAELQLGEREIESGQRFDLGNLQFPEPATVSVTLEGADDRLESMNVFWLDASGAWLGSSERKQREFISPPLPAGTITMVVHDESVEHLEVEFEVEAGAHVVSTHRLSRFGVAVLHFELPAEFDRRGSMWGELSDARGRIVWQADRGLPSAGPLELRASAPEGNWHFRGGTNTGLTAEGEVLVPAAGITLDPVRIALIPE
jgi:hypothetical protein